MALRLVLAACVAAIGWASLAWGQVNPPPRAWGPTLAPQEGRWIARLQTAPGWQVSMLARGLGPVRKMVWTPQGLLVSVPRAGTLLRVGFDGASTTIASGLDLPHGLDLHDGWLYVAETGAVLRARYDTQTGRLTSDWERLFALPRSGGHWTRTLRIGPDGALYVSVGSSCNVCEERDPRRATILRAPLAGQGAARIYASGLRNTVGFDWRADGAMFGVDNGRDHLGDDFPPDELNRIVANGFYGWPHFNGFNQPDPDYGDTAAADLRPIPPVYGFGAHTAPLSLRFMSEREALVAQHGSWNRSRKSGYAVVMLRWGAKGAIDSPQTSLFLWGFERDEDVIGRPVDALPAPDGVVYVSDDYAGVIWRLEKAR